MDIEQLKKQVFEANMLLLTYNLTSFTWGNVSGIDRDTGLVAIKPSGVDFTELSAENMVVLDLEGNIYNSQYKPSSDTATHLELYRAFSQIGGVVHTHSKFAVSFAQAGCAIEPLGTTHADFSHSRLPCTRELSRNEVVKDYEKNTGKLIVEHFSENEIDYNTVPAALVHSHGPFAWGENPLKAVENAAILENVAEMAFYTMQISAITGDIKDIGIKKYLLDKHYLRKHGKDAYYGQLEIRD